MENAGSFFTVMSIIAAMGAVVWWLRRRGLAQIRSAYRLERRLELIERLPLSAQHSLYLVRVDERSVLMAISPSGCGVLEISLRGSGSGEAAR